MRATEPLGPPLGAHVKDKGIGGPPISCYADKVKNESSGSDMKANDKKQSEVDGHSVGPKEKVDKGDTNSASANPN